MNIALRSHFPSSFMAKISGSPHCMLAMPAAEKVGLMMHWPLGQFLGQPVTLRGCLSWLENHGYFDDFPEIWSSFWWENFPTCHVCWRVTIQSCCKYLCKWCCVIAAWLQKGCFRSLQAKFKNANPDSHSSNRNFWWFSHHPTKHKQQPRDVRVLSQVRVLKSGVRRPYFLVLSMLRFPKMLVPWNHEKI